MRRQVTGKLFWLIAAACGALPAYALADTFVSGVISASSTWTVAASPYVVTGDVIVEGAATPVLTIQPGVTIKFNANTSLSVAISYPGGLQAVGTSASPIVFTANSATPTAGYWRGVRIMDRAVSSSVAWAMVSYGGWAGYGGGIHVQNSSPTISNVTVQNNTHSGISVNGGSPSISSSTISANPTGVVTWGGSSPSLQTLTISGSTWFAISQEARQTLGTVSGLTLTGNGTNAVELRSGTVDVTTTWKATGWPYIATGDIYVEKSTTPVPVLTVAAGVTVKFNANFSLQVGPSYPGALRAIGTSASRVTFTANTGNPTAGYWRGVRLMGNATAASTISYATVSFAGWAGYGGGIHIQGSSPTISNVTVQNNTYSGLSVNGGAPTILNGTFAANAAGLVNMLPSNLVKATLNYWSAANGPSGSGPGSGQSVSTGVIYEPWLTGVPSTPNYLNAFAQKNRTFNPGIGTATTLSSGTTVTGNWKATIINSASAVVRTITGSGSTWSAVWDGKNDSGILQPDGTYTYQLEITSTANQAATPARGFIVADRTKQLTLSNQTISPSFFSPNTDGVQDVTAVSGSWNFDDVSWTLTFRNSGSSVVRTVSGLGPTTTFAWDGKNGSGVMQPDGAYTAVITGVDGTASMTGTVLPTTLDRTPPTAAISAPAAGQTLSNVYQNGATNVNVNGTASDANLKDWTLDYGSGGSPSSWTVIRTGNAPVVSSTIGTWATFLNVNGPYTLRLRVSDLAGNTRSTVETETIGNFRVALTGQMVNPSAGETVTYKSTVPFSLNENLYVRNSSGQVIATLWSGSRDAGTYTDTWNGRNSQSVIVPDGAYFGAAVATAGTSSMTWDPGDPIDDTTPQLYFQSKWDNVGDPFWPFFNRPLKFNWNWTASNPRVAGRAYLLFASDYNSLFFFGSGHASWCASSGFFCTVNGEYVLSGGGTATYLWNGLDPSGAFRTDIRAVALLIYPLAASGNAVYVYGTRPLISNVQTGPAVFSPGAGSQILSFDASLVSSPASLRLSITNRESGSTLRTLTMTGIASGRVSVTWDGRASNGMFVAPGTYLLHAVVTDAAGNLASFDQLTNVAY